MKNIISSIIITTIASLFLITTLGCSDATKTAGSASETTSFTVTANVVDTLGIPVANAKAFLISNDLVNNDYLIFEINSDQSGKIQFDSIPVGNYRLIVRDTLGILASTIGDFEKVEKEALNLGSTTLQTEGVLKIESAVIPFEVDDKFFIPGTDISAITTQEDVDNGYLILRDLPQGIYEQVFYQPASSPTPIPLLNEGLTISSGTQEFKSSAVESPLNLEGFASVGILNPKDFGGRIDTVIVSDSASLAVQISGDSSRVVRISGMIQGSGLNLKIGSNKTIEGIGDSSGIKGFGFVISQDSNIIIRNLNFIEGQDDALRLEKEAHHIWVDHNTFSNYIDDLLSIKNGSDYITISWNSFLNHRGVSLIGNSDDNGAQDSGKLHVTFHHNWFNQVKNATPRIRFGTVHIYNCLFDSIADYAVVSTMNAQVLIEGSYFNKVTQPTLVNYLSPEEGFINFADDNILINSGEIITKENDFDPADYYSVQIENTATIPNKVRWGAGAGKLLELN